MDLSDDDVQQLPEADRREVDPPAEVEMASWSPGGRLDYWVKERQQWWGRIRSAIIIPALQEFKALRRFSRI
jgi:hypothetical protein